MYYTEAYNLEDALELWTRINKRLICRALRQDPQLLQLPALRPLQPMSFRESGSPCGCDHGRKWNQQCLYELCKQCCDARSETGKLPYPCTAPSHKSAPPAAPSTDVTSQPRQSTPPASTPQPSKRLPTPAASLPPATQRPRGQKYPLWEKDEMKRRNSVEVTESNCRQRQILDVEMRSVRKVYFYHTVCLSLLLG